MSGRKEQGRFGSPARPRRKDRAAGDELVETGYGDTDARAPGAGAQVDDGEVACGDEAVDGATVDVQSGSDGGNG